MNRDELSIYPDIEEFAEGSKLDSNKYNKNFNSIEESVLRAILNGRDIKQYTEKLQKASVEAYKAMNSAVSFASNSAIEGYIVSGYDSRFYSPSKYISVDHVYGNITPKISKEFSKIARVDGVVNPNLKMYLKAWVNDDLIVNTPIMGDVYDAVDGKPETFWISDVFKQSGTPATSYELRIDLPPTLTNRFNMIKIDPYPLYGIIIDDISYYDQYGGYISLRNSESFVGQNPIKSHTGAPLKVYTAPIETNGSVFIKFRPINNLSIFGFSDIDFKFVDFVNNSPDDDLENQPIFEVPDSLNDKQDIKTIKITKMEIYGYFYKNKLMSAEQLSISNLGTVGLVVADSIDNAVNFINIPANDSPLDYEFSLNPGDRLFLKLTLNSQNLAAGVINTIAFKYE